MFIALAVPSIGDRAALIAAAVGFSVTLMAKDAPMNSGLLIGAAAGIAFGMLAKTRAPATSVVDVLEGESDVRDDG
jgi:tetrahydromethanopterin S-methyltransferase subunit F